MVDSVRGKFVWHELMTPDPKAAAAFYGKVVGWQPQPYERDPNYTLLNYGGRPMGGILGHEAPRLWLTYIATPNVDSTAREAVQLGGTVVKPAADIPEIGRFAILTDPQGAMFVAFTPKQSPGGDNKPGLGDFSWHELMTTDWSSAWNFYQKLFGWQKTESMEMGPGSTYQMFGTGGGSVGGMFNKPAQMQGPPQWLPYAVVKDSKATAKTIATAGGKVINGPMEVPGGDWITQGIDPQGVMFAVHSRKTVARPEPAARTPAAGAAKRAKPARRSAKPPRKPAKAAKAARRGKSTGKRAKRSRKMSARKRR
jgi:uncharacterized protein